MNVASYFKRPHQILRDASTKSLDEILISGADSENSGKWVDGEWIPSQKKIVEIFANIQPAFSMNQTRLLPEGDRDKRAIWGSSNHWVFEANSGGKNLFEPDIILYNGGFWEIKGTMPYENSSALQHVEFVTIKVRDEDVSRYEGIVNALRG